VEAIMQLFVQTIQADATALTNEHEEVISAGCSFSQDFCDASAAIQWLNQHETKQNTADEQSNE